MALISDATKRNWMRLNSSLSDDKLTSRANKKLSRKKIIPTEYLSNKHNRSKLDDVLDKIENNDVSLEDAIFTLAVLQLTSHNVSLENPDDPANIVLSEYSGSLSDCLLDFDYPQDEFDFMGVVYQSLLYEGSKNETGSYYTPEHVATSMIKEFSFNESERILDPCCGSGAILLACQDVSIDQLFGFDVDEHAVFICKINLICKFPNTTIVPHIFQSNFLEQVNSPSLFDDLLENSGNFEYVATNPPWGSKQIKERYSSSTITSGESASMFIVESYKILKYGGIGSFLLPKAILNIAVHSDVRKFLLKKCLIKSIDYYPNLFSGVTTELVNIKYIKISPSTNPGENVAAVSKNGVSFSVPLQYFEECENYTFRCITKEDRSIHGKVFEKSPYRLDRSDWALGIVTGNNKEKVYKEYLDGAEPIYTGKEIEPFTLKQPSSYIFYDPANFQQTAKEHYYRCPEKLVYKFISKKLIFAIDETGSLFLNSANILIPNVPGMSTKTVLAFLNSSLFQYLYITLFDDYKILKSNLMRLPFPKVSMQEDAEIKTMVEKIIQGEDLCKELDLKIFSLFKLSASETCHIEGVLYGKTTRAN